MFEVGFTEIVLIFAIALLVLGPARLPKLAADLGRWAGEPGPWRDSRTQLEQEVHYDPLHSEVLADDPHRPTPTPTPPPSDTPPSRQTDESKPA
jgi:sec-independent protein translocase protein TatB